MARWWQDDAGAVTVDWVVLAAAVVGLAIAATGGLQTGAFSLANMTGSALSGAPISALGTLGFSN